MRSAEEEERAWCFHSGCVGRPRENCFVEEDVGRCSDAACVAYEDVEGIRGVMGSAEVDSG